MRVKTSKIRFGVGVGVIALFAWSLPACSDDDDGGGSSGSSGSGGAGASGGSAGASTGGSAGASTGGSAGASTGGSAGAGTGGSAGASTGNCVGQEAGLQATYGPDNKTIAEITGDCARDPAGCLAISTEAENKQCVNDCVQAIVQNAVTAECTGCFAGTAWCSRSNCITQCIDGGQDCTDCQCDSGCIDEFETCSGVTSTTTCN